MESPARQLALTLCITLVLSACGTSRLSDRTTNPVIKDYVHPTFMSTDRQLGVIATDVGHRVIITTLAEGTPHADNAWQKGEFCAEPPPDAAVSVAGTLSAGLGAHMELPADEGDAVKKAAAQAEFNRAVATAMTPLLRRSQGLQWNRDQMSYLCHAYLNRRLTHAEYIELMKDVIKRSHEMITAELPTLPKLDITLTALPGAPQPPAPTKVDTKAGTGNPADGAKEQSAGSDKKKSGSDGKTD